MKIYKILIFILNLSLPGHVFAQQAIQNKLSPNAYKPSKIELKKIPHNISVNSHEFVFIDERDDTTRLGFFVSNNQQYFFLFPKPAAVYLNEKLNPKKSKIHTDTLYVGIKRLWISQITIPATLTHTMLFSPYTTIGYCHVVCNFYKKDGPEYSLINTYDSIVSKKGYLGDINDKLLEENLSAMAFVADSISELKIPTGRKKIAYPGIDKKKPAILTAEKPIDGIYLTFNDFLNNKPVNVDFEYNPPLETIRLKETRSDDSIFTEKSWGFCKNNISFMRVGRIFSKLTKIENTFELRAMESLQNMHGKAVDDFWLGFNIASDLKSGFPLLALLNINLNKKSPDTFISVSAFKLDIETGSVY